MPTYIALLRGINVGGHAKVKMDQLRALFEALRFADVKTYVQSGNVVFKAGRSSSDLVRRIESGINREFGLSVSVIVRTPQDMNNVIRRNPFLKEKGIDLSKLHVTFLSESPGTSVPSGLAKLTSGRDQFRCSGKEIYLYCPDGYGTSKLSNNAFEKLLSVRATTRNWNSINRIYEMSLGQAG
jgi:uncharacterized protein (DUF1697 family)